MKSAAKLNETGKTKKQQTKKKLSDALRKNLQRRKNIKGEKKW